MTDLTVIVPTADRPDLVLRAVGSLLQQSRPPKEIIVVDNGRVGLPSDFFPQASWVRVLRTAPLIGPGKARNIGAEAARSEYIGFLDDDDLWEKNYIEASFRSADDGAEDVIVGRLDRQDARGARRRYKEFPITAPEQRRVFFENPGFGGQNFIIRREIFLRAGGFDEAMPASVDRDLAARLLLAGVRIRAVQDAVAILCDHDGERVRYSQVRGNWMFLRKHWGNMRMVERLLALSTLTKRWLKYRFRRHAIR